MFRHYIGNGTESAHESFVWEDSPQTDGHLTVLTWHDGEDREIFVYDTSRNTYQQITDNQRVDR